MGTDNGKWKSALEERKYWDMEMEPFLNTPQMKELQLYKLKMMLKRLYCNAPFHRKRLDAVGVNCDNVDSKIKDFADFAKIIPIYDKEGYRQHAASWNGDLIKLMDAELPMSVDELTLINSTTGTTGDPTPYPFTQYDLDRLWGEHLCRGLWRAGVRSRDRIIECFGLSMHIGGIATVMGLQRLGLTVIPVGAESGTDRIFQMTRHYKPTAFIGTPSLASYLIDKAPEKIGMEAKAMGIQLLLCGGEPGPGVPEIKKKIENGFNAKLIDHGAGFGVSCVYPEYQGMHWLMDDAAYYELVDPDTKESIPLEDGAQGEAVFTCMDANGMASCRVSLGDIHKVWTSPCPCGGSGFRYKVVGRTDDMLKVKGVIVYPTSVASVVESFAPRLTGEFRIVLTERPPMVDPPLKIKIERGKAYPAEKIGELEKELLDAFHSRIKIRPKIIWQEPGELERFMVKGKKFEKLYDKK